jgi:hypothetical protein
MRKQISFINVILLIVVAVFFLVGCATVPGTTTPNPLSKEKQFIQSAKSFYISQYKDYEAMTVDPTTLSEAQKQILRQKREVLIQVKPMIDTYSALVDAGKTPTLEQEQAITQLLNQLGGKF